MACYSDYAVVAVAVVDVASAAAVDVVALAAVDVVALADIDCLFFAAAVVASTVVAGGACPEFCPADQA